MTAAGQAQAAAAQAVAPALAAFSRSLARTPNAGPAENALVASWLHGCLGSLASAVNSTGYAAAGQWRRAFLDGQAADPDWLQRTAHAAAQLIQGGANLTVPIRAVPQVGADVTLPAVRAGDVAWKACHDLGELIAGHGRAGAGPQVPECAAVLGALRAACEPLAAAVAALAPRLVGVEPDPFSVWCEGFGGDLAAAYRDAAGQCRAGGRALRPVCARAVADARTWRSRSRRRPARR
jgi:hypothetical protein